MSQPGPWWLDPDDPTLPEYTDDFSKLEAELGPQLSVDELAEYADNEFFEELLAEYP